MLASEALVLAATCLLATVVAAIAFFFWPTRRAVDVKFANGLHLLTCKITGRVFEGESLWAEGKRNGLGMQWNKDGALIHCGRWADDELVESCPVPRSKIPVGKFLSAAARAGNPQRTMLLPDGSHFVGDFKQQRFQPHGSGTLYRSDGQVLSRGIWLDGKLHGRGKQVDQGHSVYEGSFEHGRRAGLGQLTWTVSGQVYEGEFKGDEPSGLGIKWARDGRQLMCGRWAGGRLVESRSVPRSKILFGAHLSAAVRRISPQRLLLLPNGGYYVGEFNGIFMIDPHGEGVEFRADGSEAANGQWCCLHPGKLHGRGKQTFLDGSCQSGQFVAGRLSGPGKFTWPDGSVYMGEFRDDKMEGLGMRWDARGRLTHCGRWKDGELSMFSQPVPRSVITDDSLLPAKAKAAPVNHTLLLPDGGYYVGGYSEDHRQDGNGVAYRADGTVAASGHWTHGRLHGLAVTWDEHGKMKECGRFEPGRLVAECAVPRSLLPDDPATNNYDGADLLLPGGGRYVGQLNAQHQQNGQGVEFTADGSESASGQWRAGKLHGRGKTSFRDGSRFEGEFVDGKRSGLGVFTWAGGRVFEGEFGRDDFNGLGVEWTKDGEVAECGRWADDDLVESRPVPRSKIPVGKFLSAAAKESSLLFPDGGFYRGEINAQLQRHGKGSMHAVNGRTVSEGVWRADRLLTAAEVTALAVAALAPAAAAPAATSVAPADGSLCVVCQDARPDCHTGCAHICMCMQCAKQVHSCPQCRKTVTKRSKVFIS